MADLISRQAAIDALKKISFSHWFECGEYLSEDTREIEIINSKKALEVIEALSPAQPATNCSEFPNNSDTISRQAAIRWVKTECNPYGKPTLDFESGKKVIEHPEQMPSAEPERKKGNEKCSNELPCGWCSLFDTPCFGRGGEQDG